MRRFDFALICVVLAANALIWRWTTPDNIKLLTREHGILESAQIAFLMVSLLVFLYGIYRNYQAVQSLCIIFAALCFVMLFREIDWRRLNVPSWLAWTDYAPQRDILFIGMMLVIAGYQYWQRSLRQGRIELLSSPRAWAVYVFGALLAVSFVMDVVFVGGAQGRRWEEMFELDAYVFLLAFAARHVARSGASNLENAP